MAHTLTGTVLGTLACMSYEQASSMKNGELGPGVSSGLNESQFHQSQGNRVLRASSAGRR
jgi:hypothetical protein